MTTEAEVLQESIKVLKKGFTPDVYFGGVGASCNRPGPNVEAACAVGGVEQALWALTGRVVTKSREHVLHREKTDYKDETLRVYAKTIKRLNRLARKMYKDMRHGPEDLKIANIEELTFTEGSDRAIKGRVLKVFRAALAEVQK